MDIRVLRVTLNNQYNTFVTLYTCLTELYSTENTKNK